MKPESTTAEMMSLRMVGKEVARNCMDHTTPVTFPEDETLALCDVYRSKATSSSSSIAGADAAEAGYSDGVALSL
jgi:hypothetical protein